MIHLGMPDTKLNSERTDPALQTKKRLFKVAEGSSRTSTPMD
jgi:hypothetical protein